MLSVSYLYVGTWDCKTNDFQPCTLPFKYNDIWYDGCTKEIGVAGKASCAIDADRKGKFLSQGMCGNDCPGGEFSTLILQYIHILCSNTNTIIPFSL